MGDALIEREILRTCLFHKIWGLLFRFLRNCSSHGGEFSTNLFISLMVLVLWDNGTNF